MIGTMMLILIAEKLEAISPEAAMFSMILAAAAWIFKVLLNVLRELED